MRVGSKAWVGIQYSLALIVVLGFLAGHYESLRVTLLDSQRNLVLEQARDYESLLLEIEGDLRGCGERLAMANTLLARGRLPSTGNEPEGPVAATREDSLLELARQPDSGLQAFVDARQLWLRELGLTTPLNQRLSFTPLVPPRLATSTVKVNESTLRSRRLLVERTDEDPDLLRVIYPVRQDAEILLTLELLLTRDRLQPLAAVERNLLGSLLLVNERNQVLQRIVMAGSAGTDVAVDTLADALPKPLTSGFRYPQDVIAGGYQATEGIHLLRLPLDGGGWHVFHILPNEELRLLLWPKMALPLVLVFFFMALLAGFYHYRGRYRGLDRQIEDYEFLFRNSKIAQLLVDTRTDSLIRSNRAASRLFGFPRKTLAEIPFSNLCRPADSGTVPSAIGSTLKLARIAGNQKILVDVIASIPEDRNPLIQHYFLLNPSSLDKRSQNIRFQAYYDPLTQLPNRNFLFEHLQKLLATHRRENHSFAVLFVDLDRFKQVNDTLGHDIGDQVLLTVGERLKSRLRESDILARLGGDEFTIILPHLRDQMDASMVARTLVKNLSEPLSVAGYDIHIGASVGISIYPDNGEDANTLLKNADIAMYQAKEGGRGGFCFFQEEMNDALSRKAELESDIQTALEKQQFVIELQPIVDAGTLRIAGAEVLLRWQHPLHGLLSPTDFIRIAEETGQIAPISEWLLQESLGYAESWLSDDQLVTMPADSRSIDRPAITPSEEVSNPPAPGGAMPATANSATANSGLFLAINLSQRQLINTQHVKRWQEIINNSRIPSHRITLELDEQVYFEDSADIRHALNQLLMMGVKLSLNDFGNVESSLKMLKNLPVSAVKVDFSSPRINPADSRESKLNLALVKMGLTLDLVVTAVGVENVRQLALLAEAGCPYVQGYLFSPPLSPQEFRQRLPHSIHPAHGTWPPDPAS